MVRFSIYIPFVGKQNPFFFFLNPHAFINLEK